MATYALLAATAILLLTHALISLRRLGRTPLDRPAAAMFGAALMVLLSTLLLALLVPS